MSDRIDRVRAIRIRKGSSLCFRSLNLPFHGCIFLQPRLSDDFYRPAVGEWAKVVRKLCSHDFSQAAKRENQNENPNGSRRSAATSKVVRRSFQDFPRTSASASHPRRNFSTGTLDKYGFRSRMGVPSSMSTPRTRKVPPSRPMSSTTVSPMGFGRLGERVANTPWVRLSEGGVPSNSNPSARSKTQRTIKCEKPSISVSPGSN